MPYKSNKDLPKSVRDHLPKGAQDIYRKVFNSAHETYQKKSKRRAGSTAEQTAARVAWAAVKRKYKKNVAGKWVKKILAHCKCFLRSSLIVFGLPLPLVFCII